MAILTKPTNSFRLFLETLASQFSYLFNVQQYPDPRLWNTMSSRNRNTRPTKLSPQSNLIVIKNVHLPDARETELSHIRRTVADPQECAQHMNAWIPSAMPKFRVVTTLGSTSNNVTKTRELMRKYDIAPDQLFISPSHFRHRPC